MFRPIILYYLITTLSIQIVNREDLSLIDRLLIYLTQQRIVLIRGALLSHFFHKFGLFSSLNLEFIVETADITAESFSQNGLRWPYFFVDFFVLVKYLKVLFILDFSTGIVVEPSQGWLVLTGNFIH